jgi:hypothetical protein
VQLSENSTCTCRRTRSDCPQWFPLNFSFYNFLRHIINISSPIFSSPAAVPPIFSLIPTTTIKYHYPTLFTIYYHFFLHLLKTTVQIHSWRGDSRWLQRVPVYICRMRGLVGGTVAAVEASVATRWGEGADAATDSLTDSRFVSNVDPGLIGRCSGVDRFHEIVLALLRLIKRD